MSGGLSHAQERIWFLERVHPATAAYNVSSALRLRGRLDIVALEAAWATLVRRHDALRSRFPVHDERPRRIVEEEVEILCERIAPRPHAAPAGDGSDALVSAGLEDFARRPFDIAEGPLARVALAHLAEDDHVLVLVLHHLIADGWSLRILHQELAALYGARLSGREPALAVAERDYEEHVLRERTSAAQEDLEEGLSFWRKRLARLEPLQLPCDHPRPAAQTLVGGRRIAWLSEQGTGALEALARSHASSLFLVLQLAFAVLVHRWTGQCDIAIGAPFATRADTRKDAVVGLLVNTIVLRYGIDGKRSFEELLAHHRDSSLEAFEHGEVPFEAVVEAVCPQRSLSRNPLFAVMFALQRAEAELPAFESLQATLVDLDLASTRFDLECTAWREPRGLRLRLTYALDLFAEATAARLLERYVRLLECVAGTPQTPICELDLLVDRERRELTSRRASLSHPDLLRGVPQLLEAQASRTPAELALQTADGGLRYGELLVRAQRVAGALRRDGLGRGDVVAVRAMRGAELVAAMIGVMRCGAALLPLDRDAPPARARALLADARVRAALAGGAEDVVYSEGVRWTMLADALAGEESLCPVRGPGTGDAAYVIYTSGSAGRPKGVVVEHRNVVNTLVGCREWFGFDAEDRFLCLASPAFDIFYFELLSALVCGASVRLLERRELLDPACLTRLVRNATVMQAVPSLMREIVAGLAAHPGPQPQMRHAITGGDIVPPALLRSMADAFPGAAATILYGPTEAAMVCAGITPRDPRAVHGHPLGQPLPNVELRVYDDRGRLAPVGFAGEIYIGGGGVCRGYLGEPPVFADRFVELDGKRFYRSGDRGRWRADGSLEFLGRVDDQIKLDGFRIEPAEIEAVMEADAEVREAAVVACTRRGARRLYAYVTAGYSAHARDVAARRHVADWRALFEHAHRATQPSAPSGHDFTGWRSSYTGTQLTQAQMEDWLASSLAEIVQRLPSHRRPRVLEIGCGTGLLLFALAPACELYSATDFAGCVLDRVRAGVIARGWSNVELHEREAVDLTGLEDKRFDAVILNSVVQYLPGIDYLCEVLERALRCVVPGGFVFVGDVRNLALHEPFLAGVELRRRPTLGGEHLREAVRRRAARERELLVHPAYFAALTSLPRIAHVDVAPRRGRSASEMQRYRYNAVIYTRDAAGLDGGGAATVGAAGDLQWIAWREQKLSLEEVLADAARERPPAIALSGVPNALLSEDLAAWTTNGPHAPEDRETHGQLVAAAPEDLREGAARVGYEAALSWARGTADGSFDAVLYEPGARGEAPPRWAWLTGDAPARLANDPLEPLRRGELVARLRAALGAQLPTYMVPAAVSVLDELPRTSNGKLDRGALAARAAGEDLLRAPGAGDAPCASNRVDGAARDRPASATERVLARAWGEVLGCEDLTRTANFFAAGGTSLLAIRVAVRLKGRGVAVSAQDLFRHQTVAELAAAIDARRNTHGDAAPRAQVQPASNGARPARGAAQAAEGGVRGRTSPRDRALVRKSSGRAAVGTLRAARSVLLTGATGFLGMHLLHNLLGDGAARVTGDGAARVTCLVRASDDGAAEARLADQWAWYFPGVALERARVRALAGDVTHDGLGLRASLHRAVARDCEHVVHAAADVRHVGDEGEIFRVNVGGTANVVELVQSRSSIRLHHISTIGVKGVTVYDQRQCTFTERDLDIGQTPTENYSASKLEAERIVRRALAGDAGGTVQRIGTLAAHSLTGRFQRDGWRNFFLRYVRATVELGAGCDWPGRSFALTPVDAVARAVILLADAEGAGVQTFHLSTPHKITHGELIEELRRSGYAIRVLEPEEFVEYALRRAKDPRWESTVGSLLSYIDPPPGRPVRLDSSWTLGELSAVGFRFPRPTSEWLGRFVAGCVDTGALPGAASARMRATRTPRAHPIRQ